MEEEIYTSTFFDRLEEAAGIHGNMAELSRYYDLHYNTILKYKTTKSVPDAEVLLKLYREKGLNIHWLLTGEVSASAPVEPRKEAIPPGAAVSNTQASMPPITANITKEDTTITLEIPKITLTLKTTSTTPAQHEGGSGKDTHSIPLFLISGDEAP